MSMRFVLAASLLLPLASAPMLQAAEGATGTAAGEAQRASSSGTAAPPEADTTPELGPDLMYAVLVAEIANQRGDRRMAFTHYLHAARLSRDPALAELASRAALNLEDSAAARRAASLWVDLEPASAKAHQISAYVHLDAGDHAQALAELERVVELAPNRAQGYLQAVRLLTRLPEPEQRLRVMRELVAATPDDADAQFALATLAAAAGDSDAAMGHAERAAGLREGWNKPRMLLIRLLLGEERQGDALAALESYLRAEPDDQELVKLRAQFHIDNEEYEQALALFDRILDAEPGQPDVLFAAAVVALQVEQLDQAREYAQRLRRTGKRAGDSAFLLGQVEEAAGNLDSARDWFKKVRGENSTNAEVRIASIHAEQGEIDQAREILRQLRVQYPTDAVALYLIEAELLREHGLKQQALDVYGMALRANPDNPDVLYARAMLAASMGRVDLLERDLRRILIEDPDHVDALNALGYTLADRTDRLQEAYRFIERALQLRPEEPAILDSMGWVLYRMGEVEAALPYLRKALDQAFDAEIAAHLGEVLWELGRRDEARQVWRRALDEDPNHEYLLQVLGRYRISHTGTD